MIELSVQWSYFHMTFPGTPCTISQSSDKKKKKEGKPQYWLIWLQLVKLNLTSFVVGVKSTRRMTGLLHYVSVLEWN